MSGLPASEKYVIHLTILITVMGIVVGGVLKNAGIGNFSNFSDKEVEKSDGDKKVQKCELLHDGKEINCRGKEVKDISELPDGPAATRM